MAESDETPKSLMKFNTKVADLIKSASADDLVYILQHDKSLMARHNQNINNKMAK
jgi:hypothetical protein